MGKSGREHRGGELLMSGGGFSCGRMGPKHGCWRRAGTQVGWKGRFVDCAAAERDLGELVGLNQTGCGGRGCGCCGARLRRIRRVRGRQLAEIELREQERDAWAPVLDRSGWWMVVFRDYPAGLEWAVNGAEWGVRCIHWVRCVGGMQGMHRGWGCIGLIRGYRRVGVPECSTACWEARGNSARLL